MLLLLLLLYSLCLFSCEVPPFLFLFLFVLCTHKQNLSFVSHNHNDKKVHFFPFRIFFFSVSERMTDGSDGDEGWDRDLRLPLHGTHVLTPVHASQLCTASSGSISDDWGDSDSDDDWDKDEPAAPSKPASAAAPAPAPPSSTCRAAAAPAATSGAAVGAARVLAKPGRAQPRPRVLERTCSMRVHGRAGAALPSAISAATVH